MAEMEAWMGLGTGCEGPNPPVGTQTDLALICHSLRSGRSGLRGNGDFLLSKEIAIV